MLANSRDCKACMIVGTGGRCDGVIRIELKIEQILRARSISSSFDLKILYWMKSTRQGTTIKGREAFGLKLKSLCNMSGSMKNDYHM